MQSYGHDSLPVFGIGSELSEGEWRGVVRQLLASGLLAVKGDHGTLALTDAERGGAARGAAGHVPAGRAAARARRAARRGGR